MPALSSRLRRTKNPTTSGGTQTSTPNHHHQSSPPTLTMSPSPSTTPPNSSLIHSRTSGQPVFRPPKAPFRSLQNLRAAHKRARSPSPASLHIPTSPAIVTQNRIVGQHMASVAKDKDKDEDEDGNQKSSEKPKIPSFLCQSRQDIEAKFQELTWQERFRIQQSIANASPTFRFARVTTPETKILDRYANIQPWANNRIKLQVPQGHIDYINASPIILHSPLKPEDRPPHRYIAMQGPKYGTMEHVWRMIAEQLESPAVIVMLTETHEMGAEKCYPYFPRSTEEESWEIGEHDEFGDGFRVTLRCTSVESRAGGAIELREITLHVEGREEDMKVWHLLYRKWPDFGVPALEDIDSFFELMRLSREKNATEDNPRIVHCSAGVGRSGTFIALEILMREVDSGDLREVDDKTKVGSVGGEEDLVFGKDLVFNTVNELREQRRQMVQAEAQYLFIYQVLRKQWMEKYGVDEHSDEPAAKRLEVHHDPFVGA